jgi:hypothetical protein
MRPSTYRVFVFHLFTLTLGCFVQGSVFGTELSDRIVMRQGSDRAASEALATRLQTITGWSDLSFDANGILKLGRTEGRSGSKGARDLLKAAVSGPSVIVIEAASSRTDVVFCKVTQAQWVREDESHPQVFIVLVDFSDFDKLIGDKKVRAAFDVGWGLLHEIDHVVRDSHDSFIADQLGDCESRINTMRREVGLPQRADYFYRPLPHQQDPNLVSRFVRLRFEHPGKSKKMRDYWLMWDAALVGLDQTSESVSQKTSTLNR